MSIKKFPEDGNEGQARNPVADGGGPPYDGGMEARIAKLEEFVVEARMELRAIDVRLGKIEVRLDATATQADIQAIRADIRDSAISLIKWIVGTGAILGAAAITVMTFVFNNAVPKANLAMPAPVVINVPSPPPVQTKLPESGRK